MEELRKKRPKVFVSHASPDLWVAKTLQERAIAVGADTFLDQYSIEYGDDFEDVIINEANESTELLVLFTPLASERKYVWLELGMFLGARKRVVVALYGVSLKDIAEDNLTPVMLKRISSVCINNIDEYFAQLEKRVGDWEAENARTHL